MIDTVALAVPIDWAEEENWEMWRSWQSKTTKSGFVVYVKNATDADRRAGLYLPRLTRYRTRQRRWYIKMEFSVPKLLYGNNVDEVNYGQFWAVIRVLQARLAHMDVRISRRSLAHANVLSVHYSKNILLPLGYTAQHVISEIGKIDVQSRFQHSHIMYANGGEQIKIGNNSYSVEMYDKPAEVRHTGEVSNELLTRLRERGDVLRLEVKLKKKQKLNALFETLGYAGNPTFWNVFSSEKSRAVLLHHWSRMIAKDDLTLFTRPPTPADVLRQILIAHPGETKMAMFHTGLRLVARDCGINELRTILTRHCDERTWIRYREEMRTISEECERVPMNEWYTEINAQLTAYRPLCMDELLKVRKNHE